jgi:cysteine desulfurase
MIYADNASTTKISDLALAGMLPFLREQYGNASSLYSLGAFSRQAIEHARRQVATAISADAFEITFTSGGSEANTWVLRGIAESFDAESIHIITSSIEHHSVLNACRALAAKGIAVDFLPVNSDGVIEAKTVISAVKPSTKLVSVMLANNEIGALQPIAETGRYLREKDILFHTDAVQAVGHIPVDVRRLGVDFLSASAHKFNGAKGAGFLFIRSGRSLPQLIFGGKQENSQRAGTENVAGIVAMGTALEENVSDMHEVQTRLSTLTEITADGLKSAVPNILINACRASRLPGVLSVTFPDVNGEAMMSLLDLKGICVSTSSACNSGSDEPSHVLLALGLSPEQAKSTIRISYGRYNNIDEAKAITDAIRVAYGKITGTKKPDK